MGAEDNDLDHLRPARRDEFTYVLAGLADAIGNNEHYDAEFKAFEMGRLNADFLDAIHDADPWNVSLCLKDGRPVGFMLFSPEQGNLWLNWAYIEPAARQTDAFMKSSRDVIRHFDNGRYHKMSTYVRPDNKAPALVMLRLGFKRTALLEKHIFGQDYYLFEKLFTKVEPGYVPGAAFGKVAALKRRIGRLFGR